LTPLEIYDYTRPMPGREIVLANNEIYHVFNRGVASLPTFTNKKSYQRAVDTLFYYQNAKPPLKYAKFLNLSVRDRARVLESLKEQKRRWVEILCFCFMSNHFHLLLKQLEDVGISKFMSNFTNSYTRYFNTRQKRVGPLFQGKFKGVRIETQEQLIHVSRYIHLNPYTGYVVKTITGLESYPYSSFPEYISLSQSNYCSKEPVLSYFKNSDSYRKFVFDNADYQRELGKIGHLTFE